MTRALEGERIIAAYKTVKGALQLVLSGVLVAVLVTGAVPALRGVATDFSHHLSRHWSIALAQMLARGVTPHHVIVTAIALALDGILTSLEGWALRRRRWWGAWMVVVATGSLLPFELVAFARKGHWTELAAFALNLVIVAYLARHALARRRNLRGE